MDNIVYVYKNKQSNQIRVEFHEEATKLEDDAAFEHLATLHPTEWIKHNFMKIETLNKLFKEG